MLNPLYAAFSFLTVIPMKKNFSLDSLGRSIMFFPLVGLVIGIFLWGVMLALQGILPKAPLGVIILSTWVIVTGGLHLDGLADSLDGIAGGTSFEKRLNIMKDSRIGTYGVIAITIILLLKLSFILSLDDNIKAASLILSPVYARWAIIIFMYKAPSAKENAGLGQFFIDKVTTMKVVITSVFTFVLALVILNSYFYAVIFFVLSLAVIGLLRHFFISTLGGITGDTIGATNEICEAIILFAFLLLF